MCVFCKQNIPTFNLQYLEAQHGYVAVPALVRLGDGNGGGWGNEWGEGSLVEAAVDEIISKHRWCSYCFLRGL